jgi:cbb3-type cytochrome oxidase subunit 1
MLLSLSILVVAFLLNLFLPWWSIALPGLVFGYLFNKKGGASFGWGFLALFLLWGGQSLYIHFANHAILSTRIAEMLSVGSPFVVVLITATIGGLVSGLATLTGSLVKETPRKFS